MMHGTGQSCLYRAVLVEERRMHSGMSLFSGRQPLDTAVMAQKAEALGCDALWRRNMPSSPCQSFPLAPGSSVGSIPEVKAFHRCGSHSSMTISLAAQARKSMLAVTASQPTNKPTTPQHLPSPLPSQPPEKLVVSFTLTQPLDIVGEKNSSSMMRAVAAHGLQTRSTHAHSRTCSPTESPYFLTALLAYGAVPSRLGLARGF